MKKTALITGASGGIGQELAKIHASEGNDLVLVARSKPKLDELKQLLESQYDVSVLTIGKDLSLPNSAGEVYNETTQKNIRVDYLINNAGFGDFGFFAESGWEKAIQMINLNIATLTHLTRLYLPEMINRGQGKIMNVASTAAFQPIPLMASYAATKAYVLSFSEALNNEVGNKGVTVTALCPGPTESGFAVASSATESKLFKNKLPSSREVALFGYNSMMKGKSVAIHGFLNRIMVFSVRLTPRNLLVNIVRKISEK